MNKTFTIYSRKLAYHLRTCGFRILSTQPNPRYPQYDCYLFLDTPDLHQAISLYQQSKER